MGAEMGFSDAAPVLHAIAMAEASDEPLDIPGTAAELEISETDLRQRVDEIEHYGLALSGLEDGLHPILLNAGRQYLALEGEIDDAVLLFLPSVIDDLHARRALLRGGVVLVDEFRAAMLTGAGVAHAQEIVPPAFVPAVDERLALDLFAAAIALTTRLSDERPAGCVAEEILAVALLQEARAWLEMELDTGELDRTTMEAAAGELRGLFELFQDDDVLDMFEMREPSDAAASRFSPRALQLGIADQTVEHWFDPFGWTAPTGYLADKADAGPATDEQ
jgi:hypothetical protein